MPGSNTSEDLDDDNVIPNIRAFGFEALNFAS